MDVLTGNELVSGAVVYLDDNGEWQSDINRARLFEAEQTETREALVEAARATGRLLNLEFEKVEVVDGKVVAKRLRERIRAEGPTAPYGPERQELGEDGHVSL